MPLDLEARKHELGEAIGFFKVRIARHDERIDADILIFPDPCGDGFGITDQRRSRTAANQTDASPQIWGDLKLVTPAAMQLHHPPLPDRVHPRKDFLCRVDRLVGDVLDQVIGGPPGFVRGLAHDDVEADTEAQPAAALCCRGLDAIDLFGDLRRRLTPCQILVDGVDGDIDPGVRRSAEIKRRSRRLHRRKQQASVLDPDMLAFNVDGLAREQIAVDVEKFTGKGIALVMTEKDAVTLVFDGVAAEGDFGEAAIEKI